MVHAPMSVSRIPTRQRIVNTALELFASKGITETTTRQIADFAQVNEVTLFRHFGNKHGLLLAVLQECLQKYLVLAEVGESFIMSDISSQSDLRRFLKYYIQSSLRALESLPELVRSLVGEAGQYPLESRQALAQGINQVNHTIATAMHDVLANSLLQYALPPLKLANLLNTCILGYTVLTLTSDVQTIWSDRNEFINTLVDILVQEVSPIVPARPIVDIPAETSREILLQAKKFGVKDYAIAYLLFGTGITALSITRLRLKDYQQQSNHGILFTNDSADESTGKGRSVPLNQKIFGHRYGSATNNPLSAYNKSLSLEEIEQLWTRWTQSYRNLDGSPLIIEQARHTWCIEMLARGIDVDSLCIISGIKAIELKAYQIRLNQKLAIDKAIALDS